MHQIAGIPWKLRFLGQPDLADRAGLDPATIRAYKHRNLLPERDAAVGDRDGWTETTIDAWIRHRDTPPKLPKPRDPIAAARSLLAQIRACLDQPGLHAPDGRSPYQRSGSLAKRLSWEAAGHLARTGIAYDMLPWAELSDDLGDITSEVENAEQATEILMIVEQHVYRARARLSHRRPAVDWTDYTAVHDEIEHMARRAADLRLVHVVEELLTERAEKGSTR